MGALLHQPPATFFASVEGIDVSSTFNRYLIKAVITDSGGSTADTCDLVFDDSGGQLQMPRTNAALIVGLGWQDTGPQAIFSGFTAAPRSQNSREGGRLLTVHATSSSPIGLLKQTQETHKDGGDFNSAATQFAQAAGLTVQMDPALGQVKRDYWSQGKQSFVQWGESMARKLGATFKIAGNIARFTSRDASSAPEGSPFPTIICEAGANLIRWDIVPLYDRPRFGSFQTHWYDLDTAEHHYESLVSNIPNVAPALISRFKMFNQEQAKQRNLSNQAENNSWNAADRHIVIIGEPLAMSQGTATVVGAREGIDGSYRIETATHILSRSESPGFITELTLVEPGVGGASEPSPDPPFQEGPPATSPSAP